MVEVTISNEEAWRLEAEDLQQHLLLIVMRTAGFLGWGWFCYAVLRGWPLALNSAAAVVLTAATYPVNKLRRKRYTASCLTLLVAAVLAHGLIVAAHPLSNALAFGVLTIIAARALMGTGAALAVAVGSWLVTTLAHNLALGISWLALPATTDTLALYAAVAGMSWLAARPLSKALQSTLAGWTEARKAAEEARQRRGELYRALRALEEATSRIERMNDALAIKRREADEARALKAKFVITVSHELRGPLNLILGFSKLIALSPEQYGEPLPQAYRADVHAIYRNSQHLAALIDDVLDLSQIEAGRLPLVKDRIDIEQDVVQKTIRIVQPLAGRKGLYLKMEIAGNLPWVLADAVRLRQAMLNLLTNAVRFTEKGGITVRTECQDDGIVVSVQDTGPGIAADSMAQLFQEFRQLHRTETREGRGSGLGLSISKQLIELHGGRIWAESKIGQGTTFTFTVPLPGAAMQEGNIVRREETSSPAMSRCCLIVHPNPLLTRLLGRYIEGQRVIGVTDEQDAVSIAVQLRPQAIIASPETGQRLEVQLAERAADVPLITCRFPNPTIQDGLEGIMGYLMKPVAPDALLALMKRIEREGETRVLLVDDEPDAVRLLERVLTALPRPYTIMKAYDGQQALDMMRAAVPDIVLVDLVMPGTDGRQVISAMRAAERTRHVPVIVVSAQDWADGSMALQTPLSLHCGEALPAARGMCCLQAMLDALDPTHSPS